MRFVRLAASYVAAYTPLIRSSEVVAVAAAGLSWITQLLCSLPSGLAYISCQRDLGKNIMENARDIPAKMIHCL